MARRKDVGFEVENLDSVVRELRKVENFDAMREFKTANKDVADTVRDGARAEAPVLSGKLKKSITSSATARHGTVAGGSAQRVPYAAVIHYGWPARGIKANPFVYSALDKRRDEVFAAYEKQIRALTKKHFD